VRLARSGNRKTSAGNGWRSSVWPYALALMLAMIAALGALTWYFDRELRRVEQEAQAAVAERDAQLLVARLQQRLQQASVSLAVIAEQDRLVSAFQQGAGEQLDALRREYQQPFPQASRLALLPAGLDEPDLDAEPPIGYALLDMLRTAEQQQKAPPAEVHLPGQPEAHVSLLQPVVGPAGVVGHVVLTYPLNWLQVPLRGATGGAALLQSDVVVLRSGPTEGVQNRLPVPGSRWQLLYGGDTSSVTAGAPLAAPLALLIALLLFTALLFYLLQRAYRQPAASEVPRAADVDSEPVAQPVSPPVSPPLPPDLDAGIEVREEPLAVPVAPAAAPPPVAAETAAAEGVRLDPSILRAYDVRGVVGRGLDASVVRAFGRAIATEAAAAQQQEIVVARDGRLSSPELCDALIEGLLAGGRQVIDIGQVPTPVMHFATFHFGTRAGVMVTGSHNPRDYNGLKIVIGGRTLSGDAIKALGRRVERGDFISGKGSLQRADVLPDYIDRITQDVTLHRPLRVVIDCGNGVAGVVAPQVFRAMGCEVEELFCEVDGYFPNHHPDPTVPSNLDALISLVRLQGADVGLAFDGDGDRLGVVDARGRIIWADRQLMLFARDVLVRDPGAHVVFDVKCSAKLAEFITDNAGVPVMWKSGHSLIRNKMYEVDAALAGDMSGHIFFKDRWYGFDDAIYAGARLLEILSSEERDSVAMFGELPDALSTPEIRIDVAEGEAEDIMAALGDDFANAFEGARVTTIDGVRVDLADGWGLVRASNTQPCLVLRFEADDKQAMRRIQQAFRERLLAIKPDLGLPF
jgi:phosphomannomutase/phosphoglucomutase